MVCIFVDACFLPRINRHACLLHSISNCLCCIHYNKTPNKSHYIVLILITTSSYSSNHKWSSDPTVMSPTFLGLPHDSDFIMNAMASQITGVFIVYSTVCSGAVQRKYQSSESLTFVRGIHWWPVNSPAKRASNTQNVSIWWRHHM